MDREGGQSGGRHRRGWACSRAAALAKETNPAPLKLPSVFCSHLMFTMESATDCQGMHVCMCVCVCVL